MLHLSRTGRHDAPTMAGRPKKRAREQAAALGGIPDALTTPEATRAGAGARAREAPPLRRGGGYLGAQTRGAADTAAATELNTLARALRPGTQVRIERVRPSWAAGWIEDLTLDQGGIGELYEHLQEEWGGKTYRCTVLLPNGAPAFESRIEIAGPPMHEGSEVDRDEWNGQPGKRERERERERNAVPPAATTPAPSGFDPIALVKLMMDMQNSGAERAERTMREIATQNREMLQSAITVREGGGGERTSLVQQLGELEQAKRALDRMGRVFGAAERTSGEAGEDDLLGGAMREATKHFLGNVMASEFAGKVSATAPTQRPAPPPRSGPRPVPAPRAPSVRQRPTVTHPSGIPDALVSGQKRAG